MPDVPVRSLPLLVFVSGKPGSGKLSLARRLANALWFPMISNDAIRQGMLEALDLDVPRLRVDKTAGYAPSLDRIVAFVRTERRESTRGTSERC